MKKEKKGNLKVILRLTLITVICLGLILVLGYIFSLTGLDQLSEEQIREIIAACGAWAPIAYIIVTFLQVTFIPVPFVVTILAGNLLFGFWGSFFYSLIGTLLGSVFAFILGRRIGRPFVNWAFGDAEAVERYLSQAKGKEFVVFFFMFLLPFFPDDALCALAGITDLSDRQFAFILAISRPITILGNLILWTGEVIPYNAWGIVLMLLAIAITVASFLLSMKYADRITDIFDRATDKLANLLRQKKDEILEHLHEKKEEFVEHMHEKAIVNAAHDGAIEEAHTEDPLPGVDTAAPSVAEFPEELRLRPSYDETLSEASACSATVDEPSADELRAATTSAEEALKEPAPVTGCDEETFQSTYNTPAVEIYFPASDATVFPSDHADPLSIVASLTAQES